MKRKKKQNVKQTTYRLADNHSWTAPEGFKIVVLDRGAVIFNIPQDWTLTKLEPVEIYDKEPPDDNSRISVSFWRLPPGVDWSGLPLDGMLANATDPAHKDEKDQREILDYGEVEKVPRTDLEVVMKAQRWIDPQEHREAYSRMVVARGWNVQALITFDFWVDDLAKCAPVWDEIVRSLQLGQVIKDPTKGVTLH